MNKQYIIEIMEANTWYLFNCPINRIIYLVTAYHLVLQGVGDV